jgi:hypothetical protein
MNQMPILGYMPRTPLPRKRLRNVEVSVAQLQNHNLDGRHGLLQTMLSK